MSDREGSGAARFADRKPRGQRAPIVDFLYIREPYACHTRAVHMPYALEYSSRWVNGAEEAYVTQRTLGKLFSTFNKLHSMKN